MVQNENHNSWKFFFSSSLLSAHHFWGSADHFAVVLAWIETSAITTSSYMCSVFINMTYNKTGVIEEVLWCEVSKWSYLSDHTDFKFQNQIVTENSQRSVWGVCYLWAAKGGKTPRTLDPTCASSSTARLWGTKARGSRETSLPPSRFLLNLELCYCLLKTNEVKTKASYC